ncbi:MAG: Uma2 family endonuclease [Thermomicrobiales bacterium]
MNTQPGPLREPMTLDEYLEFESRSPVRHEFIEGELYAFAGASRRHSLIVTNLVISFGLAARGGPCEVHSNDVKLRASSHTIYYPDVMVVCDQEDRDDLIVTRPCLVVEVLSPSSWAMDRREKLIMYRRIESLQTYLIVFQDERRVIHYRRDGHGDWGRTELTSNGSFPIGCLDTSLSLNQIYEGID